MPVSANSQLARASSPRLGTCLKASLVLDYKPTSQHGHHPPHAAEAAIVWGGFALLNQVHADEAWDRQHELLCTPKSLSDQPSRSPYIFTHVHEGMIPGEVCRIQKTRHVSPQATAGGIRSRRLKHSNAGFRFYLLLMA